MARVLGLDDPHVLEVFVLQIVKVVVEVGELVRQNVAVRYYVELFFAVLLLHFYDISDESVFTSKFVGVGKVVDSLIILEFFINVRVDSSRRPHHIPVMALRSYEAIAFKNCFN